jgi:hypothetical protein
MGATIWRTTGGSIVADFIRHLRRRDFQEFATNTSTKLVSTVQYEHGCRYSERRASMGLMEAARKAGMAAAAIVTTVRVAMTAVRVSGSSAVTP